MAVVGGVLVYAFSLVDLGWIPHDEGTLAHAAGRVLRGELPHRDFDDVYTGGQAMLHAAAFAALGERLLTLRVVLFAALAATTPVVYWIARRWAGRGAAAGATALAVVWSAPIYPAAMPSWYNLFLAILAVAALLRFQDTRRGRWLVAAGACAGLSMTMKVVGLYMVAAALLYLVYLEQEEGTRPPVGTGSSPPQGPGPRPLVGTTPPPPQGLHRALVTAGLAGFLVALALLFRPALGASTLFWFFLPPAALVGLLLAREWRRVPVREPHLRTRVLAAWGLALLAGVAVPVGLFLVPYVASGAVGDLVRGAIVVPALRRTVFMRPPPGLITALPMAAVAALVVLAARGPVADRRIALGLGAGLAVIAAGGAVPAIYRAGWWLLHPLVPVVVLVGAGRLVVEEWRPAVAPPPDRDEVGRTGDAPAEPPASPSRAERFLLLAATSMVALVAFPTFIPLYVFYAAAMAMLAALASAAPLRRPPRAALAVLFAFHLVFAARWIHASEVYAMGDRHNPHPPAERLAVERGGIRVTPGEARAYGRLLEVLRALDTGPYVWATPDSPEIYFLSGLRNPGRTLFDLFDEDFYTDPIGRVRRIEALLARHDVRTVVLKRSAAVASPQPSEALLEMLRRRYPRAADLGAFTVFVEDEAAP